MNTSDLWPTPAGIIGAGAVGLALAHTLRTAGIPLAGIGSRAPARLAADALPSPVLMPAEVVAQARLIFLTVPDAAIASVAAEHAWQAEQWVVHCAGSQSAALISEIVKPAQAGAFHPLASFPRPAPGKPFGENLFAGHVIALDGPAPVVAGLRALAEQLDGRPLVVPPEARASYHLAASLASNALVALVADAVEIWRHAGLDADLALPALLPLIASTQANLARTGLPAALTGPVARGDAPTVARHLAALATPELAEIAAVYRLLGRRAVMLARAEGRVDPAKLDEIERMLNGDT